MDVRRLVRMATGGLICVSIGALSFFAMWFLLTQIGGGEIRIQPWLGVLLLGALALEAFVLTTAGLILLIWAIVAGIAGPAVAPTAHVREVERTPAGGRVPTAARPDHKEGASRLDPPKRRPSRT